MTERAAELLLAYALGWLVAAVFADAATMFAIGVVGAIHIIITLLRIV